MNTTMHFLGAPRVRLVNESANLPGHQSPIAQNQNRRIIRVTEL